MATKHPKRAADIAAGNIEEHFDLRTEGWVEINEIDFSDITTVEISLVNSQGINGTVISPQLNNAIGDLLNTFTASQVARPSARSKWNHQMGICD